MSTAAWLLAATSAKSMAFDPSRIVSDDGKVTVKGDNYRWEWSAKDDVFRLIDGKGQLTTTGTVQPRIVVKGADSETNRTEAGKFATKTVDGDRVSLTYEGVNGSARVTVVWRFADTNLWLDPIVYETTAKHDVVSVHYFAAAGEKLAPSLRQTYLVLPGISESTAISPIIPQDLGLTQSVWLGHGDSSEGILQQWGLPTHYFCGATSDPAYSAKGSRKEFLSDAFCCGLAALPSSDLLFHLEAGAGAPVLNLRSDLWGHARGPGRLTLGAPFFWAIGRDYHDAIRQYYRGLVRDGTIKIKTNSAAKNAIATASGFDTWGAQVATRRGWDKFDGAFLEETYQGLKASGMRTEVFMIDAKWEGRYGFLEHSVERFPHFESFLAQLKADGVKLGIWAAFLRCDDPKVLGLEIRHMLRAPGGKPVTKREGDKEYYLLDVTQSDVQRVLAEIARRFVRRYKPDLVKFDFGYELPSLSLGAPLNMEWAGERLLQKGLELVVGAMREVNPDLVVMYYSLSPLAFEYIDLHSPDDLFMCGGDYNVEANRRFFFSGLLGEFGMPTYGSGGYDWVSLPDIWFDSAPIGSLGSLSAFTGDELDGQATPEIVAKYNGLAQITRKTNVFSIEPLDPVVLASANGAHSSSWVRHEKGEPTLVALRQSRFDGHPGPGRYRDVLESTSSVVVASRGDRGIAASRQLGVVPYGTGELTVHHAGSARKATVIQHCVEKAKTKITELDLTGRRLGLPISERLPDGSLVEWIEINLA